LKSLLRSIKEIGAQTVGNGARGGMMGRAAWQKLVESYEIHRHPEGLPASYDLLLCSAHL
jgi:malonyl-CoA O-methyltransferase